jgi:hypothetical protein
LSDGLWRNLFGGRADIVGTEIRLAGQPHTIVGVMPASFRSFFPVDVFMPLKSNDPRGVGTNFSVTARLKSGIGLEQAEAEIAALTKTFLQERPRGLPDKTVLGVESLHSLLNASAAFGLRWGHRDGAL